jgi:hypothetical protein
VIKKFKTFYLALFITTALPFLPYSLPFLPNQLLGFNVAGWAWIIMLFVTVINLININSLNSPLKFFFPWVLYILIYVIIDFSFLGIQLTLQYILPILIGIVAFNFTYSDESLIKLFRLLKNLSGLFLFLFAIGYIFRGGYTPASAGTPMFLSITVSLLSGLWFISKRRGYLFVLAIIMLVPVIDVTRMGVVAMSMMFLFHFSNKNLFNKLLYGFIGILALIFVFSLNGFQKKTFYSGKGSLTELSLNYYENPSVNNNGRSTWKKTLQSGIESSPIWGNGPRSDNIVLSKITGLQTGEAHNDYLSVTYNYGYVGLSLLLFGFLGSFLSLFRMSFTYWENLYLRLLSTSTLTLYISFLLFMYSDNILKYTIYFPNYFFALIGITYSIKNHEDICGYTSL